PVATPQAKAMTFLHAPPISQPTTSVLVYGRKYGAETACWTAIARCSSGHAMTVAAACSSAISRAKFGPDNTAMRSAEAPVHSAITSLIRFKVSDSMPLEIDTKVASLGKCSFHRAKLSRMVCDGTAKT